MIERERKEWFDAMKAKGHSPVLDEDGDIDLLVAGAGYCNGPKCWVCGWFTCVHCENTDNIPPCDVINLEDEQKSERREA